MGWSLVVCDRSGTPLGELRQASGRGFRKSLNRGRSLRGTIRANNSLAAYVQQTDRTILKAYDDRSGDQVIRHCGPISGCEKNVDERGRGTIGWTSPGPEWRLLARLLGKNSAGASFGTPSSLVARESVMKQIIDALNQGSAPLGTSIGDTGIRPDVALATLPAPTGFTLQDFIGATPDGGGYGMWKGSTTLTFAVTAIDVAGREGPASQATITIPTDVPPFNFEAYRHSIRIHWNPVAGAKTYRVYLRSMSAPPQYGGGIVIPGGRTLDATRLNYFNTSGDNAVYDTGGYNYTAGDVPGSVPGPGLGSFGPWRYYPASSAFAELSTGLDGVDWEVRAVEPLVDAYGTQLGVLIAKAFLGALKPHVVFEFGTGKKNVKTFSVVTDAGASANDITHLPSGFPDNATQLPVELTDVDSIVARGLREDVLTEDVLTDALRTQLVQDHIAVRKVPRRTITFTPVDDPDPFGTALEERRVPRPFVDYDVGDIVTFRAVELLEVNDPTTGLVSGYTEVKTVDAFFRIFTLDIDIGDDGAESVTLTFVEEG